MEPTSQLQWCKPGALGFANACMGWTPPWIQTTDRQRLQPVANGREISFPGRKRPVLEALSLAFRDHAPPVRTIGGVKPDTTTFLPRIKAKRGVKTPRFSRIRNRQREVVQRVDSELPGATRRMHKTQIRGHFRSSSVTTIYADTARAEICWKT